MANDSEIKTKQTYEPPKIKVMDEVEMLSAFQITGGTITWWVM